MASAKVPPADTAAIVRTLATLPYSRLRFLTAVLFLGLAAVIARLAWISDDAYITLRCVENWCHGHGLVWNVAERVQAYTHPLWMLLLAAGRALGGDTWFMPIGLGMCLSLQAALVLLRAPPTAPAAAAVLVALVASRSFTEYATAGLENPLAYLLLALFAGAAAGDRPPRLRLLAVAVLTGLAALTRMDFLLLCGPALLAACRGVRWLTALALVGLGLLPFAAWLAFATVYYGTPFPITAYAKVFATGLPSAELAQQGLYYLDYVTNEDPVTIAALAAGICFGLALPRLCSRALALGILLYSAYVVKVGGDFMGGRLLTPPFVVALAITGHWLGSVRPLWSAAAAGIATVLLFVPGLPAWFRPAADDAEPAVMARHIDSYHGIVDERMAYYWNQGLQSPGQNPPTPGVTSDLVRQMHRDRPIVVLQGRVGRYGFEAGDQVHIVDSWLLDPLLMRLPAEPDWRIGHFRRRIPEGYLETIATGENRIHHAGLRRYYDALRTVIRAPVCDRQRLQTTWSLLSGEFDADLAAFVAEEYRTPPRLRVEAAGLDQGVAAGAWWFDDPRIRLVYDGGLAIAFATPVTAHALHVLVAGDMDYGFRFRREGREVGRATADARALSPMQGLHSLRVPVPETAEAFDTIWLDAHMIETRLAAIGLLVPEP